VYSSGQTLDKGSWFAWLLLCSFVVLTDLPRYPAMEAATSDHIWSVEEKRRSFEIMQASMASERYEINPEQALPKICKSCINKLCWLSDRFITYLLTRNIRVEEDLVDQLFNSIEKRLARALLLLARYSKQDQPQKMLPKISQETLAEMVGTTRSRVNMFMNKFKTLGFIDYERNYNGGIQIHNSLLSVVLHE
jgi:DNA-binding MarR family transcriptional regulator